MKLKKDLTTSLYHPEPPLFTGNSKREVFLKQVTQHLTQQVTFFDVYPQQVINCRKSADTEIMKEGGVK